MQTHYTPYHVCYHVTWATIATVDICVSRPSNSIAVKTQRELDFSLDLRRGINLPGRWGGWRRNADGESSPVTGFDHFLLAESARFLFYFDLRSVRQDGRS